MKHSKSFLAISAAFKLKFAVCQMSWTLQILASVAKHIPREAPLIHGQTSKRMFRRFEVQHIREKGKFAFHFVEGPLVRALRSGAWYAFSQLGSTPCLIFEPGYYWTKLIWHPQKHWNVYPVSSKARRPPLR